jgi:Asp-tRNA(Asn)/Glu-tRNA(Gln) amidotransferase A subunit family amidase
MARLVRQRDLSPIELVDAHLARIEALNPRLNAFVAVDAAGARAAAREAEAAVRRGEALGPLHGVPLSMKSTVEVAGLPWDVGSRSRAGVRGTRDALVVRRVKAAGAIVLGVTNVAEQLMAWETDNAVHGRTNSPWDPTRTPGGSSGGEAAAIAAGLSAGGVGSDGGGSIRVPAHFSGICGLKPTPGRVPATGHFPACAGPFSLTGVIGPMARTIGDLELLLSVMAGPDSGDPNAHPVPLDVGTVPVFGTVPTIAVFDHDGRTHVHPDIRAAVRRAADALRDAGLEVVERRPPWLDEARTLWWPFFGRAVRLLLEPTIAGHESEVHPLLLEFLEWTRREPRLTAEQLLEAEIARDLLRARVLADMERVDAWLCPVAAIPAFRHGERAWTIEGRRVEYLDAWSYSAWFNLLQNPAVSVTAGRTADGLPVGVQVVARHWEERTALDVARVIERTIGGYRPPPLGDA